MKGQLYSEAEIISIMPKGWITNIVFYNHTDCQSKHEIEQWMEKKFKSSEKFRDKEIQLKCC